MRLFDIHGMLTMVVLCRGRRVNELTAGAGWAYQAGFSIGVVE